MARINESLYYDPDDTTIAVRVFNLSDEKLEEAIEFCEQADQQGDFDWNWLDVDEDERPDADFFFNNQNTAFAFKMRFG